MTNCYENIDYFFNNTLGVIETIFSNCLLLYWKSKTRSAHFQTSCVTLKHKSNPNSSKMTIVIEI